MAQPKSEDSIALRAGINFNPLNLVIVGDMWPIDDFFDVLCGISLDKRKHPTVNSLLLKHLKGYNDLTPAVLKAFIKNKSRIPREEVLTKLEGTEEEKKEQLYEILNAFQTQLCGNPGKRDYSHVLNISEKRGSNDEEYIYVSRVKTIVMKNDNPISQSEIDKHRKEGLKKTDIYGVTIPINMETYDVYYIAKNLYFTEQEYIQMKASKEKRTVENTSCRFSLVDEYDEDLNMDEQLNILLRDIEERKLFSYP